MARDIIEVIDRLLGIVPEGETGLRAGLNSVKQSALFTAPEMMTIRWRRLGEVLQEEIGQPREPWQVEVGEIVRGEK